MPNILFDLNLPRIVGKYYVFWFFVFGFVRKFIFEIVIDNDYINEYFWRFLLFKGFLLA
jgi:hypothetical protein